MKRIYRQLSGWLGDALRHSSAAMAALLFAGFRGLRLLPDELPALFIGTIDVLEWAAGSLGLFIIFLDKFNQRKEKDHG